MNKNILYVVCVGLIVGLQGSLFAMEEKKSKIGLVVDVMGGFNPAAKNFPTPDSVISGDEFHSIPLIVDVCSKQAIYCTGAAMHINVVQEEPYCLYDMAFFNNDKNVHTLIEEEICSIVRAGRYSLKIPLCRIEAALAKAFGCRKELHTCPLPQPSTIEIHTALKGVKAEICMRNFTMEMRDKYLAEGIAAARQIWSPLYDGEKKMQLSFVSYFLSLRDKILDEQEKGQIQ